MGHKGFIYYIYIYIEHCIVWLRKLERVNLNRFEMWCWEGMDKLKQSVKLNNEVSERIEEKSKFPNSDLPNKASWTGLILGINLHFDSNKRQSTEVK